MQDFVSSGFSNKIQQLIFHCFITHFFNVLLCELSVSYSHFLFSYFIFNAHLQLVDNKIFCVHGGLSPLLRTIDQIQVIERLQEVRVVL